MALPIADHQMNCDMCSRKLKGLFKTEAYECQRCQYKVHKNHVEQEEPCKSSLGRAVCSEGSPLCLAANVAAAGPGLLATVRLPATACG